MVPFGIRSWGYVGVMLGPCWPLFGKNAWTQSWFSPSHSNANGRRSTPFLVPRGEGIPNSGSPKRWGTPFLTDFELRLGVKLSPRWFLESRWTPHDVPKTRPRCSQRLSKRAPHGLRPFKTFRRRARCRQCVSKRPFGRVF